MLMRPFLRGVAENAWFCLAEDDSTLFVVRRSTLASDTMALFPPG